MEFDVEYDVVVIGSGGSGKSAAYTVASESDLSVCVLEKKSSLGGTSQYTSGMAAAESFLQVGRPTSTFSSEEMPEWRHWPTKDEFFRSFMEISNFRADLDLVRNYVNAAPETIQILSDLGVEFTPLAQLHEDPRSLFVFHSPEGKGARVQEILERACINAGVECFCDTPAKEILTENGKVIGVRAMDADGEEMLIGAKAVVIATGGYADDLELLDKYAYIPHLSKRILPQRFGIDNSGDGLKMVLAAGGTTGNIGCMCFESFLPGKTVDNPLYCASYQPTLWVNKRARRFYNEGVAGSFICGLVTTMQDDGEMFVLHDGNTLQFLEEVGSNVEMGKLIPYRSKRSNVAEAVRECMEAGDGCAWIADTLEELAELIGVDAETLIATVNRYNELCEKGHDDDFLKDPEYMIPLIRAPYVAFLKKSSISVTFGAIKVNENLQVLTDDNEVIGGLYAVGNDAAGLYGEAYNYLCPGTANSFAHTSGRLAARHAISVING